MRADTLILQLGYILHSVQAWKKVYKLRVCVFVEYEEEIDSERARVHKLLEKLRIEADVLVFWLASGHLAVYKTIVSGQAVDPVTEVLVDECLKGEEWWDDLQALRGRTQSMSASQELDSLANFVESTAGRPGIFNPHNDAEDFGDRRRHSMARLAELPKKPTVSTLARLGVNMGIHTANLLPTVFDGSSGEHSSSSSESNSDASDDDDEVGDFNDDASAASEGDLNYLEPVRRPLIAHSPGRRKSYNDAQLIREPTVRRNVQVEKISRLPGAPTATTKSYGTISTELASTTAEDADAGGPSSSAGYLYRPDLAAVSSALRDIDRPATPQRGMSRNASTDRLGSGIHTPKPIRPSAISRHSSHAVRFSSQVIPQTEVTESEEGAGPVLGFAESDTPSARPGLSRSTSQVPFSSRLMPETSIAEDDDTGPTVSFAPEPETRDHTMPPTPGAGATDVSIHIPDLLASYKFAASSGSSSNNNYHNANDNDNGDEDEDDSAASSSDGGGLPLSFNDLPSRAQYLILNELLRQHSSESAVLFTTLPIPAEGTCRNEEASVQYLSDIEVLCNDLPPVLLVLSNNMT